MWGTTRWDCEFTYASVALTVQYSLLLLVITTYAYRLIRDQPRQKRKPQKIFLLMGIAHAAQRVIYFALWPPLYQSVDGDICSPTTGGQQKDVDSVAMNVIGSLPPCFFLSAFSINVFTFARIYHTVLAHNESMTKFRVLTFALIFVNFVIWVLTTLELITSAEGLDHPIFKVIATTSAYAVSVTSFLVAVGFMTYGVLLFYGVRNKQREAMMEHAQQNKIVVPARTIYDGHDHDSGSNGTPEMSYPPNPMKRILVVSAVCMVCFLVRSVLLPAVVVAFDGSYTAALLIIYLECSEIIPMILMLKIFEGRKDQNEVGDGTGDASHISRNGGHMNANGYRDMRYPHGGGGNGEDGMLSSLHEQLLPGISSQPTSRTTSAQPNSYGYHPNPYMSEWTGDDRGPQRPGPTFVARATSQTGGGAATGSGVASGAGNGRVDLLRPTSRHSSAGGVTTGSAGSNGSNGSGGAAYRTIYHSSDAPIGASSGVAPYAASPRSSHNIPASRSIGRVSSVLTAGTAATSGNNDRVSHRERLSAADMLHVNHFASASAVVGSLGSNASASVYSRTESGPISVPSSLHAHPNDIIIGVPATVSSTAAIGVSGGGAGAPIVTDVPSSSTTRSSSPSRTSRANANGRRRDSGADNTRRPTQVVKVYAYQGEPEFRDTSDLFQLD